MSDLQIGLLIIGVVTIAAVIAYNKIQDLKFRKLAEKNFASSLDDALLESAEKPGPLTAAASADDFDEAVQAEPPRIEPTLADEPAQSSVDLPNSGTAAPASVGDAFDAIFWDINMTGSQSIKSANAAEAFNDVRHGFSKSSRLLAWSPSEQIWVDAAGADILATHFRAGIQLVDRRGPIDASELARFQKSAVGFAGDSGLVAEAVDAIEPQERARKIDDFCCDVDIQIVLHLVSRDKPFAGTKIRAMAEADGFEIDDTGVFKRFDETGNCVYSLSNGEGSTFGIDTMKDMTSSSISLQFDLPSVPGGLASFDQFCAVASRFSVTLGASLVDDNRVEIGAGALKSIRDQVGQVQARMSAAGFPPGSPVALRLFS